GHAGATEAGWDEPGAFDPDVPAGREARVGDRPSAAARVDRDHVPAVLVGGDQLAAVAPEGQGGDDDSALEPWRRARQGLDASPAVHGEDLRLAVGHAGHEQAATEPADVVERDALRGLAQRQI